MYHARWLVLPGEMHRTVGGGEGREGGRRGRERGSEGGRRDIRVSLLPLFFSFSVRHGMLT